VLSIQLLSMLSIWFVRTRKRLTISNTIAVLNVLDLLRDFIIIYYFRDLTSAGNDRLPSILSLKLFLLSNKVIVISLIHCSSTKTNSCPIVLNWKLCILSIFFTKSTNLMNYWKAFSFLNIKYVFIHYKYENIKFLEVSNGIPERF